METPQPIAYELTVIGKEESERVPADSFQLEGDPRKYVFRKAGNVVREIFVTALENEPKPIYPQTPEQKAKWREFVERANAANQSDYLKR